MINGKRVHRALGRNKRIAEELYGEMVKQRNAGKLGYVQSDTPWAGFKRRYETWAAGTKNPTTQAHNTRAIRFLEAFRHPARLEDITPEMLDAAYHCPVDLIAHGVPHRVLSQHEE